MLWNIFCRVVDNFGDIGVCWRLAADLARRGDTVRLWTDDASALAWMAPQGAPGVEVRGWPTAEASGEATRDVTDDVVDNAIDNAIDTALGDVVIEAFGCDLPPSFVRRMAAQAPPPVWINLEYLSAEQFVERNHGLPSPQASGPGQGLTKWFFYPGFTDRTGGLLREADLAQRQAAFDARAWQEAQGIVPAPGEQFVSLFCYDNPALPALLDALAAGSTPTLLLATAGHAARQVQALLGPSARRGALRAQVMPALSQRDYDHLLWSCELNLVRGEDSFVRAQWAGKPFLWQIYPQDDGVHATKLAAFHRRFLAAAAPDLAAAVTGASLAWNGLDRSATAGNGSFSAVLSPSAHWAGWQAHCHAWRASLRALPDLTAGLRAFVLERR